jgi:short-subunit dehydrogenase
MKIQGSKVLLTGASGGIGRAFIDELLRRGVAKVYAGVRSPGGEALPSDPRLEVIQLDVTDPASIAAAARKASDVNLLINNAGIAAFSGALTAESVDAARQEMEVNYFGPLQMTRALKDTPVFSASGAIVNVISFLALVTLPLAGTYSVSKSAVLALTRSMRAELKASGTQVVAVLPVQTDTKLAVQMPDPKVKPSEVAIETLDALESGLDEVFPGEPSKKAAQFFKADPSALQANLAQRVHAVA